ncbi:signal-transducing adaptor protein 2 isoform X3 [Macrotis lagotis]|uniref:signal-transducing adaptor protein 2 isoform X3 n=1 Tax=Macrotis lagotis TaxID=92651 RepID=UPI003D69FA40
MATAPGLPRVPKPKPTLPSHYYEGFLEKKGPKDRDYKKFWAGLQGLTIYLYNNNRDPQYVEKVDLSNFLALTDDAPKGSSTMDPGTQFCLSLEGQEIRFKVDSLESREMWKGFIMTVVELKVPSNLTLLPGHKYMMAEALSKEKDRRVHEKPSCFLNVSRVEAQLLLERSPECGNMLLRPGSDRSGGYSITTRQTLNGAEVVRHYKVKREGLVYVIDVEEPVSCSSLHDVVNYFVANTKGALVPFCPDEDYEKVLALPTRLLPGPKPKKQGKPLPKVPPVPNKTKTELKGLVGPKKVASGSSQLKVPFGMPISTDITEELEKKLQQRRANLEK